MLKRIILVLLYNHSYHHHHHHIWNKILVRPTKTFSIASIMIAPRDSTKELPSWTHISTLQTVILQGRPIDFVGYTLACLRHVYFTSCARFLGLISTITIDFIMCCSPSLQTKAGAFTQNNVPYLPPPQYQLQIFIRYQVCFIPSAFERREQENIQRIHISLPTTHFETKLAGTYDYKEVFPAR